MGSRRMSKGHRVGLLSLLMIHKAYLPSYKGSRFFSAGGRTSPPEVVQEEEALADLKKMTAAGAKKSQLLVQTLGKSEEPGMGSGPASLGTVEDRSTHGQ